MISTEVSSLAAHDSKDSKAELLPDALQAREYVQASSNHAMLAYMDM
jgi:hypothetical protein